MGLGPYPMVCLADARKERDRWEAVLKSGDDPLHARERQREDERTETSRKDPTFEEAANTTFDAKKACLRKAAHLVDG